MRVRKRVRTVGGKRRTDWVLDLGLRDGHRRVRCFRSADAAKAELAEERRRMAEGGLDASGIPGARLAEFARADRALRAAGLSLEQVVRAALTTSAPRAAQGSGATTELLALFLADRERKGCRASYLGTLRVSLGGFAAQCPRWRDVCPAAARRWLLGNRWSPRTQRNYLGDLRVFSAFAGRMGWGDPLAGAEIDTDPLPEADEIQALSLDQCAALALACARTCPELLGYLAAALWGGIRSSEAAALRPPEIDPREGHWLVRGKAAKSRQRRVVEMCPAARKWTRLWRMRCGPDAPAKPPNWRARLRALADAAAVPWSRNVLRHTAASMWVAATGDAPRVQALLGHESAGMLWRHYRAVTGGDGRAITRRMGLAWLEMGPAAAKKTGRRGGAEDGARE
jgi:integrase